MSDKGYEFFEHTADVGVRIGGTTLPELFEHAALALTNLVVEEGTPIRPDQQRRIELQAARLEDLLQGWLKELLFWFSTDRFLTAGCTFETLTEQQLRGVVHGERFDPNRHAPGTEVKGVTYHQFQVTQGPSGWEACVIFDV